MLLPLPLLLLLLEFPVVMALIDCWNRPPEHFAGGPDDRTAWLRWLLVAILTVPVLLGYGITIGYYHSVVRRNSPTSRD